VGVSFGGVIMAKKKKSSVSPMVKALLSQLFRKPATCQYPFVKAEVPEGFRGKQVYDINLCISCGLCSRDCPASAIEMVEINGKRRPLFHLDQCIFCYQCAESCPRNAIQSTKIFELATTDKSSLVIKPEEKAQKENGEQK
jgi:formate hydrogenlyase subunit 6/NADH:ubiquinone oxidoreductase subunit I